MMKVLHKLTLLAALTVGFSLTAMAQRQDPKKDPPPKENRPTIPVKPKNDDRDRPRDDNKNNDNRNNDRRRPQMAFINDQGEVEVI